MEMNDLEHINFNSKVEFRNWLQKNHESSSGIWMIFFKKHTDKECINYNDALEEALCFGWIDSLVKKIDDEKYARKFTPRKNSIKWSEINKKKVIELIKKGEMTQAGLKKMDFRINSTTNDSELDEHQKKGTAKFVIPDFIINEFAKNEPALVNFNNLAPSHQRNYILWITNAKREETIMKRINESIGLLKENKTLGLK
jgi:uncharacterized protein YdeI (YjbR/CyaY-like superfamily)